MHSISVLRISACPDRSDDVWRSTSWLYHRIRLQTHGSKGTWLSKNICSVVHVNESESIDSVLELGQHCFPRTSSRDSALGRRESSKRCSIVWFSGEYNVFGWISWARGFPSQTCPRRRCQSKEFGRSGRQRGLLCGNAHKVRLSFGKAHQDIRLYADNGARISSRSYTPRHLVFKH